MSKIHFGGEPPRMDFSLFKNHTGATLVDTPSKEVHSVSEGEIAQLIADAGNSLRRTIEATLKTMTPGQSIRIQILIFGNAGFTYGEMAFPSSGMPSFGSQLGFVFGEEQVPKTVIKPVVNKSGKNDLSETKKIIVVGHNSIVPGSPDLSQVKHPETGNDTDGADIVSLE